MAIFIEGNKKIKSIFANVNGEKKSISSAWANKDGVPTLLFCKNYLSGVLTWAEAKESDLATLLDWHYSGKINLYDYWLVGDKREVNLSAINSGAVSEAQIAQKQEFVLLDRNIKTLAQSVSGHDKCVFVVGQKNVLQIQGYMNATATTAGGWNSCKRRTWCNETYPKALPLKFLSLFKQHENITATGTGSTAVASIDLFALVSEKELFGTIKYANSTAESKNILFEYYKAQNNRIKDIGYFLRSPSNTNGGAFCLSAYNAVNDWQNAASTMGIAPFGVI